MTALAVMTAELARMDYSVPGQDLTIPPVPYAHPPPQRFRVAARVTWA